MVAIVGHNQLDFSEEIDAGEAWLDEIAPGWFEHINLAKLDLSSGIECVLGQLAMKDFREQIVAKVCADRGFRPADLLGATFGFSSTYDTLGLDDYDVLNRGFLILGDVLGVRQHLAYEQLTLQWQERIEKKRANAGTLAMEEEN